MTHIIASSPADSPPETRAIRQAIVRSRTVVAILLALVAVVTAAQVWTIRARTFADFELQTASQARSAAVFARQVFGAAQLALQSIDSEIATAHIVVEGTATELHTVLKRTRATSPVLQGMGLVDRRGRIWVTSDSMSPPPSDLSDRPFFIAHRDGRGLHMLIDRPVLSRPDNLVSIPVSMRLSRPDGSFDGMIAARLDPAYFADFFAQIGTDAISLVDGNGIVHARHPQIDLLSAGPEPVPPREGDRGAYYYKAPDTGSVRLAAAHPVDGTDLIALASVPCSDIEREWVHRSNGAILTGLAMAFVVLAVTSAMHRRGRKTARLIERQANEGRAARAEADQFRDIARNKSDFLAQMGHEIRTPLNAIIGFSEVIATDAMKLGAPTRYRDYAGDIHFSAEHLLGVINRILDMSKIDAGKWNLALTRVNAAAVVSTVRMLAAQHAGKEGVTVEIAAIDPRIELVADEGVLAQLLLNLAINAIKFAGSDRRVELGCTRCPDGHVEFRVADRGRGMSPADAARALRPFETAQDDAQTRKRSNTGLGLPLSRMFAELHGGTLAIDTTPGKGTTVRVLLPQAGPT
jgi:two-component system, cell cycle sensor histidine kinase PleC